jgi:5-methylcytosine-specific restriction endonuclease McrA
MARRQNAWKRPLPWVPPPAPHANPPFQYNLFDWGRTMECEREKILGKYWDSEVPYVTGNLEQELARLPGFVAKILERRFNDRRWRTLRKQVYARDGGRCMVCGGDLTGDNAVYWECGHIIDRFLGGPDHINNLVVMCITCNRLKPPTKTRDEYLAWAVNGGPIMEISAEVSRRCLEGLA